MNKKIIFYIACFAFISLSMLYLNSKNSNYIDNQQSLSIKYSISLDRMKLILSKSTSSDYIINEHYLVGYHPNTNKRYKLLLDGQISALMEIPKTVTIQYFIFNKTQKCITKVTQENQELISINYPTDVPMLIKCHLFLIED